MLGWLVFIYANISFDVYIYGVYVYLCVCVYVNKICVFVCV